MPSLSLTFDIGDELLVCLLELAALSVELTLRLCERPLVLPQPLGGSDRTSEERFLLSTYI